MLEPDGEHAGVSGGLVGQVAGSSENASLAGGMVRPEGLPEIEQIGLELDKPNRKRVLTQGTMLILVLFVIAAGTLYGMRVSQRDLGTVSNTQDVEAKIDQALAKLASPSGADTDDPLNASNIDALFQETDQIVSVFNTDMTERQVPAQYVKKNPFVLPVFQAVPTPGPTGAAAQDQARRERLVELQRELGQFELQSIMQGARPVAIISGDLVQPGEPVGSFTVKTIHDFWVQLESEGHEFTLRMPSGQDRSHRSSGSARGLRGRSR